MKELFRDQDITRVNYYQALLEDRGIETMIRNEYLAVTEAPIPEFFPSLCVLSDDAYVPAVQIIREHLAETRESTGKEIKCVSCGELNPGNFETCWSCGNPVAGPTCDGDHSSHTDFR